MLRQVIGAMTLCLVATQSQAALFGRMPLTPGGVDYRAYYDTDMNITWVTDANLAKTRGYDADGLMAWDTAQAFVASLNATNYLGVQNWRLPSTLVPDATCGFSDPTYVTGFNCTGSEMGHLYYIELANPAGDLFGPPKNSGPFVNLIKLHIISQYDFYWSGTEYAGNPTQAHHFLFNDGYTNPSSSAKTTLYYAFAVRSGDIDADLDGVGYSLDNCSDVYNPNQLDANGDGYGNLCDGDLNNSGLTTSADFNLLRSVLNQSAGSSPLAAAADMNGSGLVTSTDFSLLRARLNTAPGPSGLHP